MFNNKYGFHYDESIVFEGMSYPTVFEVKKNSTLRKNNKILMSLVDESKLVKQDGRIGIITMIPQKPFVYWSFDPLILFFTEKIPIDSVMAFEHPEMSNIINQMIDTKDDPMGFLDLMNIYNNSFEIHGFD